MPYSHGNLFDTAASAMISARVRKSPPLSNSRFMHISGCVHASHSFETSTGMIDQSSPHTRPTYSGAVVLPLSYCNTERSNDRTSLSAHQTEVFWRKQKCVQFSEMQQVICSSRKKKSNYMNSYLKYELHCGGVAMRSMLMH